MAPHAHEDLQAMVFHVGYELRMLVYFATLVDADVDQSVPTLRFESRPGEYLSGQVLTRNALIEATLIHARNTDDFLTGKPEDKLEYEAKRTGLIAVDYAPDWNRRGFLKRNQKLDELKEIHKRVAHLDLIRIGKSKDWVAFTPMATAAVQAFTSFIKHLRTTGDGPMIELFAVPLNEARQTLGMSPV